VDLRKVSAEPCSECIALELERDTARTLEDNVRRRLRSLSDDHEALCFLRYAETPLIGGFFALRNKLRHTMRKLDRGEAPDLETFVKDLFTDAEGQWEAHESRLAAGTHHAELY
jgi:hypothetical protein